MNGVATAALVGGCIGLAILVGAGGTYIGLHKFKKPPPVEVKMAPEVTPPPAPPPAPAFGPVPHVVVNSVPAPTPASPAPAVEPAPAVVEKPVVNVKPKPHKKKKKKASATKQLKTKWAASATKPFSFGDLFNVR